jgi:uncharacterized protein YjdB
MNIYLKPNYKTDIKICLANSSRIAPRWSVSDPSVVLLYVDGETVTITALKEGRATVSVLVDCDFGSGFTNVTDAFEVIVGNPPAVTFHSDIPKEVYQVQEEYWSNAPQ